MSPNTILIQSDIVPFSKQPFLWVNTSFFGNTSLGMVFLLQISALIGFSHYQLFWCWLSSGNLEIHCLCIGEVKAQWVWSAFQYARWPLVIWSWNTETPVSHLQNLLTICSMWIKQRTDKLPYLKGLTPSNTGNIDHISHVLKHICCADFSLSHLLNWLALSLSNLGNAADLSSSVFSIG